MSPTSFSHQSRPFSPYRHAPTQEDLLAAATRGRAIVIPEEEEPTKAPSVAHSRASKTVSAAPSATPSHRTRQSVATNGKASNKQPSIAPSKQPSIAPSNPSSIAPSKQPSVAPSHQSRSSRNRDVDATPTPSRPHTPDIDELNQEEARIVEQALASAVRTPRTSYYTPSVLDAEVQQSSFHDNELCILLHQLKAPQTHDLVRKVVLKAVKQRMKKLSMNYDNEVRVIAYLA